MSISSILLNLAPRRFAAYIRGPLVADEALIAAHGNVDLLFVPTVAEIYPFASTGGANTVAGVEP